MTRDDGLVGSGRQPTVHGEPLASLSSPAEGRWVVNESVNVLRNETFYGSRNVVAFQKRPQCYDDLFRAAVARNPEGEAVVCGERRVSYRHLDMLVNDTAQGLVFSGLHAGGRVAIMLDNRLEYLQAILAIIRAGGIAVPLGTRLGPDDIAYIVGNCEPQFVVTSSEWLGRFPEEYRAKAFLVDGGNAENTTFEDLSEHGEMPLPVINPDDTMMIVYTSGTTGKPKGAQLTHVNFVHTSLHYVYALSISQPLRSLLVVPGTHIAGFGPVMSTTIASAGTIVMMREFKAARVLETIAREKITFAVLVPAMYQLCLMDQSFDSHDLSQWIYGVYGGAIMPPATIERFASRLPDLQMINAYGATETCAVCTIMPPELTAGSPTSVGMALHCDELRIVDDSGADVPAGQSGELWIRGPNVSPGYWRNPQATADSFSEGFWKSGDIASRDEDGLIYIHDRLKDMINRGGFKVFSAEVENAIMGHPDVADCAVVGVPDPVLGEKTFAYIQYQSAGLPVVDLRNYLLARIADYKVPDFWHIGTDPVPRNQNGKQQKVEVRQYALRSMQRLNP